VLIDGEGAGADCGKKQEIEAEQDRGLSTVQDRQER
jgi:hypothetical protein